MAIATSSPPEEKTDGGGGKGEDATVADQLAAPALVASFHPLVERDVRAAALDR